MNLLIDVPLDAAGLARMRDAGAHTIDVIEPPAETKREIETARLARAEVLFCTFPPTNLADARALRWVQVASAGYTQLVGLGLAERGIRATNALGCFDVPIAEWCVAMMVNLLRDMRQLIRNQDAAVWDRGAVFQRELRGMTAGIWGYGGIGRETARLARALGLRVHVLTRHGARPRGQAYGVPGTGDPAGTLPDRVFTAGQEIEFLGGLDFLVVALPLTKSTDGLIGERELQALPRAAYVLNPARGAIIREVALLRALREGWIAGAALDTHYKYPLPPGHPLWRMPNVILTPHISGSSLSPRFRERLWDIFAQNLLRLGRGEPLLNELTPAQLAGE
ncbi:MAG: D-2-hydroxyacid dehydrogenase [Opitutaceae bacterium]|nr:D-2-hydroxyacid dehydrogenase [Opitutaceae bacterium]